MPNPSRLALLAPVALALLVSCGNEKPDSKPKASTGPFHAADTAAPTGSGVIKGVIKFEGTVPPPESWAGSGNADCKSLHGDTIQVVNVKDGKLQDVFVYVKDGLPKGSHPVPAQPVVFDQKGCEFTPRVFGIMTGQTLAAGNSDKLMHNVKSPEFNQAFPFGAKKDLKLSDSAVMATIKCDVHPWMRAYAGVVDHPYFAVTKEDGAFEIKGLVDGEYTVAAWHEKLGTQEQKVKVAAAAPASLEVTFKK
jgi:hypothetical protein